MQPNKAFGVTPLDFGDKPLKQRMITGDINIVFAKKNIIVIYFNRQNMQKAEVFSNTDALFKFINNFLENKGE